jgi:hypothetical protein
LGLGLGLSRLFAGVVTLRPLLLLVELQFLFYQHGEFLFFEKFLLVFEESLNMLSPALYLLQFVVERSLGCFVLVCLEFFESLILLEGRDVFSQFIDKGCGSMF